MGDLEKRHAVHKRLGNMLSLGDKVKSWARGAKGVGKAFLPEIAAGALGAALFARSRNSKKEKTAISKAWELESKPGRSTVTKQVSMIDGHRGQIAASEGGSVDSVLNRHKKVKQSIGDSMKLAGIKDFAKGLGRAVIRPADDAAWALEHHLAHREALADVLPGEIPFKGWKPRRDRALGSTVGGVATLGGAYALGKRKGGKEKTAVTLMELLGGSALAGGAIGAATAPQGKRLRNGAIGAAVGPLAFTGGVLGTSAGLDAARRVFSKVAMTAMQPPADPQIQQKFRGRPPKAKDTTTVMGAMQDTNKMLAPATGGQDKVAGALSTAIREGAFGSVLGGLSGAVSADKGERWKGFRRGALAGAGAGALTANIPVLRGSYVPVVGAGAAAGASEGKRLSHGLMGAGIAAIPDIMPSVRGVRNIPRDLNRIGAFKEDSELLRNSKIRSYFDVSDAIRFNDERIKSVRQDIAKNVAGSALTASALGGGAYGLAKRKDKK